MEARSHNRRDVSVMAPPYLYTPVGVIIITHNSSRILPQKHRAASALTYKLLYKYSKKKTKKENHTVLSKTKGLSDGLSKDEL